LNSFKSDIRNISALGVESLDKKCIFLPAPTELAENELDELELELEWLERVERFLFIRSSRLKVRAELVSEFFSDKFKLQDEDIEIVIRLFEFFEIGLFLVSVDSSAKTAVINSSEISSGPVTSSMTFSESTISSVLINVSISGEGIFCDSCIVSLSLFSVTAVS
jgi:hypothetical protein